MSPANIENALKAVCPLVGAVIAIGDQRPHVTALITLDPDVAAAMAPTLGLTDLSASALAGAPAIKAAVAEGVEKANTRLSRVEHIRGWTILPTTWEPGGDELTPTLKLRRTPIIAKYAADIERLYQA
jgi:long-subunit acyl-CoA synthetase (AMP-forming)